MKKTLVLDYKTDIYIDDTALDVEWLNQPTLMFKYSVHVADLEHEMDLKKEALNIVRAELDQDIRSAPEKYGITKITETVITNLIPTCEEYETAIATYLETKHEHNIARAAVVAIHQRKDALENLVRLYGQSYFAGPSVPRNLSEFRKETSDLKVGQSLNKKKNKPSFERQIKK